MPLYNGLLCTPVIEVKSEISFTFFDPPVTTVFSCLGFMFDVSFDKAKIRLSNCFLPLTSSFSVILPHKIIRIFVNSSAINKLK